MLPSSTCQVLKRAGTAASYRCVPGSTSLKHGKAPSTHSNFISQFRGFCTYSERPSSANNYTRKSKIPTISREVAKQMREDAKLHSASGPKTGPASGSIRSRKVESKYPRYPEAYSVELEAVQSESAPHLAAIQKHFSEELDITFDDWELVQAALTHYSYSAARKTNDSLSRLGEKALRFIIVTELQKMDSQSAKQSWFLTTNLRFLTRFEFLSSYIDSTLQLGPLTRYHEPSDAAARYKAVSGKEVTQYRQSVVAKSIMALVGVIYKTKGEKEAREFVRTLFIDPYRDDQGIFQAPVLQPMQIKQTGGL